MTVTGLDEHQTRRTSPKHTKGARLLTGVILDNTNVSWDNVLLVMPHKVMKTIWEGPHIQLCVLGSNIFARI